MLGHRACQILIEFLVYVDETLWHTYAPVDAEAQTHGLIGTVVGVLTHDHNAHLG